MLHPRCTSSSRDSFSCLRISYSFWSCSFNSCISFSDSSILHFSLCLFSFLLLCYCLFASIAKATFCTSGSTWNLHLCSSFAPLEIFLLPLSCAGMFTSIVGTTSALLDAVLLTILQWCRLPHWAWRSYENISMGLPPPNDMPHGSIEIVLSCSDLLQNNVGHMDCSFRDRRDISWSPLLWHPYAQNYVSRITRSTTEEWAKQPSSFSASWLTNLLRCGIILLAWRACPWKTLAKHVEASPCCISVWRCQTVRHTNPLCRSVPPLLPSTWKVEPAQISSCTLGEKMI